MTATDAFGARWRAAGRLGFGVSGPLGFEFTAGSLVEALVHTAYCGGVRLFDSAPFYGLAQRRLGQALAACAGDDAFLISKVGTRRRGGRAVKDFTPAGIRSQVEQSLADLRRDRIDLLLLHGPPEEPLAPAARDALLSLQAENKIGAFGVAGRGSELERYLADPLFVAVQAPVWSHWPARCQAAGKRFIGIEALASMEARRSWLPRDVAQAWLVARRLARLRVWGAAGPFSQAAGGRADAVALLREALARRGVDAVLTTTSRIAHLRSNLAALAE